MYHFLKKKKWNGFVAMTLLKQGKKNYDKLIVVMPIPKQGEKKILWQTNCGNGIAEIRRKKKL